jgi:hypothetical protein
VELGQLKPAVGANLGGIPTHLLFKSWPKVRRAPLKPTNQDSRERLIQP